MHRTICFIATVSLLLLASTDGRAQPIRTGVSPMAQPGVLRTLSATPSIRGGWHIATSGTYGWEGDNLSEGDSRHRAGFRLALGYSPWSFLQVSLDAHSILEGYLWPDNTQDSLVMGVMGDPRIAIRSGFEIGAGFSAGAIVDVVFPSGWGSFDAAGSAISPSFGLLLSFAPERIPLGVHFNFLYKHDRSSELLADVEQLHREQVLLAGVSSAFHHLEFDLAVEYRIGPVAPYLEMEADLPVGEEDVDSAVLVGFGARLWLGPEDAVQLNLGMDFRVTGAPEIPDVSTEVYVTAPPLLNVHLGVAFRLPVAARATVDDADRPEPDEPGDDDDPDDETQPTDASRGRVAGQIRCAGGPCGPTARVAIVGSGGSALAPEEGSGAFTSGELSPGTYRINATAEGFQSASQEVVVTANGSARAAFDLSATSTVEPTRISGVVADFNGNPVEATIIIPALGVELQSDETGRFQVDVEAGRYEVIISASGYRTQHSRINVHPHETVVMNVELRGR